jgi:hypothetical protein
MVEVLLINMNLSYLLEMENLLLSQLVLQILCQLLKLQAKLIYNSLPLMFKQRICLLVMLLQIQELAHSQLLLQTVKNYKSQYLEQPLMMLQPLLLLLKLLLVQMLML